MLSELVAVWFAVLWAISAVAIWLTKATVWLLTAPLRFYRGYQQAKHEQDQSDQQAG